MTRGAEYLIGLPKILELPDIKIDRNNRMVLESGALKIIRKVRPDWPRADIMLVSLSHGEKLDMSENILLGGYTEDKSQMVLVKIFGELVDPDPKNDEIILMRLFAHNFLGPRIYATFENGIAYEYVAGKNLDYELAVDRNVYPLVATKVGKMHRLMSQYAGPKQPGHASHQIFNTLRNWLMLVPMRLADPENHQRMIAELPSKATLVNELDELELRILHYPPSPTGNIQLSYIEPQLVFCHNDLNPNNILYDPVTRQVSFIHLEFADMNFQAFEMARHFYTLCGSDLSRVGSSDFVPAPEFQFRWCQYYIAAYENILVKEVDQFQVERLCLLVQKFALVFLLQEIIWSLIKVEDCKHPRPPVDFDILGYGIKRYEQFKKSKFHCNTDYKIKGGSGPEDMERTVKCLEGGVWDDPPVCISAKDDRLYSEWGDWEDCSVTCGGGTHKRVRTCTDPTLGGSVCVEDAKEETKSCNDFECPDISVAFNGFWAPWGPWEGCLGSCGSGEQKRSRVCVGPENGGEDCIGNVDEEKRLCGLKYCDNSYPYTSEWTEWSSCSHSCGSGGSRTRVKYCFNPPESLGLTKCSSTTPEVETDSSCPGTSCPTIDDSEMGNYTDWSECNLSISGTSAFKVRNRECSNKHCSSTVQEIEECDHPLLTADQCLQASTSATPTWGCWSEWSSCSISCNGPGKRYRQRVCVPGTDNIGSQDITCTGDDQEDEDCNDFACHALHCPSGYQYSFGQTCYYLGSELTNAAGAAVSCAVKHGGRPAVFVKREELNEIKLKISSVPKAWIGMARKSGSDYMILADGRDFSRGEFLDLESSKSPDETACSACDCVFIDEDTNLRWGKCSEKRQILCEYKGPACPKGMYQLWGKCFGVAKNTQSNTPIDTNCNWKSGDSNFKMGRIENSESNDLELSALKVYFNYKKLTQYTIFTGTKTDNTIGSMTTSGSGEFYAFTHSNDAWELKKIDSEDDALSLCSFKNNDLQCDFNSPYWEDLECAWSFRPSEGLISAPLRRMEWVKFKDFNDENYWFAKDPKIDNYHLAGYYTGDYMLLSAWQQNNKVYKRMFYPMFGFAYKAVNTNVKVSLIKEGDSNHVIVLDRFVEKVNGDESEGWHYFSKNLSHVDFLKDAWDSDTEIKWRILIELNVRYHGEFAIDNLGPCAMDEVFFPRSENSNHGIGSCFKIKADGKVRFEEANDVCLDSSGKGSLRSSFSRRDPEYDLLLGALDFLHETNADNYDRTADDFVLAKERVWEGFEIPNAHYLYPMMYADGTTVYSGDFSNTNTPYVWHEQSSNRLHNDHRLYELNEQISITRRHPSSKCFVRAWGNRTDEIITPIHVDVGNSKVVCQAGSCPAKFGHYRETEIIQNDKQCFGVSEEVTTQNVNMNNQRAACTSYDIDSELMEENGAAWCEDTFINHIMNIFGTLAYGNANGAWVGKDTSNILSPTSYIFNDGQNWGNVCGKQSCSDNDECDLYASKVAQYEALGKNTSWIEQKTANLLTKCDTATTYCENKLQYKGLIVGKDGEKELASAEPSESHRQICIRSKLPSGTCHDNYMNTANGCVQWFPHLGKTTVNHGGWVNRYCGLNGGDILRDDGGSKRKAAWELMKVSGINDLRSRKYPQLTEFITLLSSDYKTHVAFNWPVTRLEGDYCENTNGYVCQRPAAAGTKVESIAYKGCYSKSNLADQTPKATSSSMTVGFCTQVCLAISKSFHGVEGENCFCFDDLKNTPSLTNRHCRTKCPGDHSQICGGAGAMSVAKSSDESIVEVMAIFGGKDDPTFEILHKNGETCTSDLPSPPEPNMVANAWTTRKDRYFIMCGGCNAPDGATCTKLWNCYILDLATSQWKTMRTPYTGRRLPTLVYNEYHDKLFYFSGANNDGSNGVLDRVVEKYSFDVGEIVGWQSVNEPPEVLPVTSGVSEGHFLYLYGIWQSSAAGSETKLLSMDVRTEQWTYHDTAVNVQKKYGAAMTIVDNFYGSKAMLMVSGRDSGYNPTSTSEYAIMHDPNDPSSFTFHKMEMTDLELYLQKGPIAELEDEIITVRADTGIVYKWDKEKSTFIDTTKTVSKLQNGFGGYAYFKTNTRWDGTACGENAWKYSLPFDSCIDAFKKGMLLPSPGQSVEIKLSTGTSLSCYGEDPYNTNNKCPDGWTGKKGEEKCLKWIHKPENNANAARQCYKLGSDLYQDEDDDWNTILRDSTYFTSRNAEPIYPGYIHLGLHQKQIGNNFLYYKNGIRVSYNYDWPQSFLPKERKRTCMSLSTLHSSDDNVHGSKRYMLRDVDCNQKAKFACTYNPDFMGFHFLENIEYTATIDITFDSMSASTCLAYCKGSNEANEVAILLDKRCICSKDTRYKTPKFKLKNTISGKYITTDDVDAEINVEDASGDDSQLWTWKNGKLESIKHPGNVIHLYQSNLNVMLKPEETDSSTLDYKEQSFAYERGTFRNIGAGTPTSTTDKILNENNGKLRSNTEENGADSWELEFDGNIGNNVFERLTFDKMRPAGAWPFDCDEIIPCNNFDGQTCGCSNEDGTNKKAIVYYLGSGQGGGSGSAMTNKLDFKSCADLKDNGVVYDGWFNIDGTSKYCKNHWNSDCGRGFKRIGSICVNVSSEAVASSEIQAKCAELGASPLTITSSEMFYQLRAYTRDLLVSDDLWSDFKDGNSATSYQNSDGNTIESMNMGTEIWVAGESYAFPCAILSSSGSDQHKLKSLACTHQAKYACMKQSCATGTILFANKGCIKIETSAKNRADAETQCNSLSQGSRLLTIKNSYEQEEIEKILQQNGITDDIHLGASKDGTQWLWSDGSPVFVTLSDSTQPITATADLIHANRLAKYSIDGMLYDGQYTFINQKKWIKIDLPEVLLIRGVKAFSAKWSSESFKWIDVRVGETDPGSDPSKVNSRCTQYGSSAAEYSEIYMRCSHPGLKGNIITLDATSWHVAVLEIEVFDCPNGFVHLNNKCVKWLADDTLVNHHKQCDLYRGKLLDASENILLALSMMSVADRGEIFSGVSRHANLSYINDMSYEGREYDFIDTFITLYGVIAQKNSNDDGFDYLPTYASPEEKYPAICVYFDEIIYTNWGISNDVFEPVNGKECAKICSSSGCDYTWRGMDCTDSLPYICEVDLVCPEGWAGFQNSCYKLEKWKSTQSEWADDTCIMSHDSDLAVPNTNEEAQFISDFINAKAATETYNTLSLTNIIIGARQDKTKTYIEYNDGTLMTNGTFTANIDEEFGNGYTTGSFSTSIGLTIDGVMASGWNGNILCEKSLLADKFACMSASNLANALTVNTSTTLTIWQQTPQKCIEYCRGLGFDNNTLELNLFAIVYNTKCTCGTGPLDTSYEEQLIMCEKNNHKAFQGVADESTVAIYNAGYGWKDYGEHLAPDTCWIYTHQLGYTIDDDIKYLNLQMEPGKPILQSVDCTYSSPFCEKPLLTKKSNSPTFTGTSLENGDRIPNKQSWYSNYATIDSNGFTIKFDSAKLITGVWWSANKISDSIGYISSIGKVKFTVSGKSYSGDYLSNFVREYDSGQKETGATIVRFLQPVYTDEITFTQITSKANKNYGYDIAFNFEVYGCDDFQMDTLYCPDGWYSSRGYCIKVIESDTEMNYDQAQVKCESIGGVILEPYNEISIKDSTYVLTDILNNTDKKFWVGIQYASNAFKSREMWEFKSGVPIYEFQFPYWAEESENGDTSGLCAMAKLNDDNPKTQIWSKEDCDSTNKGVLCSRRHFWEEIPGCYASPSYEFEGTIVVDIPSTDPDNVKFCRDTCKTQCDSDGHCGRYFILKDGISKCHCITTSNAPKGGFVAEEQCGFETCTSDQDPHSDDCNADDGYARGRIYKTYSLTCPALETDYNTHFYFPWDFHGNFHVGSKATLKCLPGYVLPKEYKCNTDKCGGPYHPCLQLGQTGGTCKASRSNGQQVDCIFPFKYGGETYEGCAPYSNGNGYWCPYQTYSNGNYKYGSCNNYCDKQIDTGNKCKWYFNPELDYAENTQTVECIYDPNMGGKWDPSPIACEPLKCKNPDDLIPDNTELEISYSPSSSIFQYFETNAVYNCPLNTSIPDMLLDEMSFDYSNSIGIVQQINLTCGIDEQWLVSGGIVGETCEGATGTEERCLEPKIPDCVDKNPYCTYPPSASDNGKMIVMDRPLDDYLTVPGTTMYYYCPTPSWAFDYSYDTTQPSFYFTKNVNNITIICNENGFWEPDNFIEGETCINKQPDGGCEKIYIPACVDRNIYCTDVTTPTDASRQLLQQPNYLSEKVYSTVIEFSCASKGNQWYFDYALPEPFISFYYSTNIAKATATCNEYGLWTVTGGIDGETCTDWKADDDELWCSYVSIPACVDRTIRCDPPPSPDKANINILTQPNPNALDEYGTSIEFECPDRLHYFDYPVEEPFISFYYTENINYVNVSCNHDGLWDVYGGQDGLTCDDLNSNLTDSVYMLCSKISVPDCVDRTVYCVNPPSSITGGDIIIDENPSPYYKKKSECMWTRWFNTNDNIGAKGDAEYVSEINGEFGTMACAEPTDIKARIVETKEEVPKEGGPEVYRKYEHVNGFVCMNKDQDDYQCMDYEVSLCCPPGPENGTIITLVCNIDDWYLDYKDLAFQSSLQLTCSNNSTWTTQSVSSDICRDGSLNCEFPKMPNCQDRTVLCLDDLPIPADMVQTNLTTNETLHGYSLNAHYAYSCATDGFVVKMPGYPEEVHVQCSNPPGYFTDEWTYELWRSGFWTNYGNLTECIDPFRCYDELPKLPVDFTVSNKQSDENPDYVNTTIQYTCSREYWVFDIRDMYENCDLEPDNCEAQGFKKIHSFDKSVDATNVLNVTCEEGYRADTLPDWVWRLDGFEFTKYMPSCYDPTYCEEDPPHVSNAIYKPPEKGTMKYKDGEQITYICENPVFVFPEPPEEDGGRHKDKWESYTNVVCGWGKKFQRAPPESHPEPEKWPYQSFVPQCVDPRGCPDPPYRNERIWGSFEDSKDKSLEVGTAYWYECRSGQFDFQNGTLAPFIELKCVNDETGGGGAPYWSPPYDGLNVPFPKCKLLRFNSCLNRWCHQSGTNQQYTKCGRVSEDGRTCYNPSIKYGYNTGGYPYNNQNNNAYKQWCQQLFPTSNIISSSVTYSQTKPYDYVSALYWGSGYDESGQHWSAMQYGYWASWTGRTRYTYQLLPIVDSLTCLPKKF